MTMAERLSHKSKSGRSMNELPIDVESGGTAVH